MGGVSSTRDALPDVLWPPRRWWSIVSLLLGRDHRRCQERGARQRRWREWGHASVCAVLNGVTGICLEGGVELVFERSIAALPASAVQVVPTRPTLPRRTR